MAVLADLRVLLSADTTKFAGQIQDSANKVERFAGKLKKAGMEIAQVGAMFTAVAGLMVNNAAKFDKDVAAGVDRAKNAFNALSVELGRALLPIVQSVGDGLTRLTHFIRGLSPETKGLIVQVLGAVAAMTSLGFAGAKIAGLAKAFAGLAAAAAPMLPVLIPVVLAIGAIVVATSLLRTAWDENWFGMRDTATGVVEWIGNAWGQLTGFLATKFNFIKTAWDTIVEFLTKAFKGFIDFAGKGVKALGKFFGKDWSGTVDAATATLKDMADRGIGGLVGDTVTGMKVIGTAIKSGLNKNLKDGKDFLDELTGGIKNLGKGPELKTLVELPKGPLEPDMSPWAGMGPAGEAGPLGTGEDLFGPAAKQFKSGAEQAGEIILNSAGAFSGAIQTLITGDWIGALIQFVAQSQGFKDVMGVVGGILQALSNVLGKVLVPLQPLIASLMGLIDAFAVIIDPIFQLVGSIAGMIAPLFVVLGETLKGLAPVIAVLLQLFIAFQAPLTLIVIQALPVFFMVLKGVGWALLKIASALGSVWNTVISAIFRIIWDFAAMLPSEISGPLFALAGALAGMIVPVEAMSKAADDLWNMTLPDANAIAKHTADTILGNEATKDSTKATKEAADQIERVTESMMNVPSWFKVGAARFNAANAGAAAVGSGAAPMSLNVQVQVGGKNVASIVSSQQMQRVYNTSGALSRR